MKASLPPSFSGQVYEHLALACTGACFKRTSFSLGDAEGAGKGCLGSGSRRCLSAPRTTLRCPKTLRGKFPPEVEVPSSCDIASSSPSRSGVQWMVTSLQVPALSQRLQGSLEIQPFNLVTTCSSNSLDKCPQRDQVCISRTWAYDLI